MNPKDLRYQLESNIPNRKGSKHVCPNCEKPKQFTRYVDTRTGELLPEPYGICNRQDRCGHSLSPYYRGTTGTSYAEEVYQEYLENRPATIRTLSKRSLEPKPVTTQVHAYPDEIVTRSLQHYEVNNFAQLLWERFGVDVGNNLLRRFQIGTSTFWPGACVFWYIDEQDRVRSGQVVLFDKTGHTVKETDREGNKRRCTSWVHTALTVAYKKRQRSEPDWLMNYKTNAPKSPIPFGLHQIRTAPTDQPIAIVEAPKTAVVCSACFPQFIWIAIGALDYLTVERVTPLRNRKIRLFPDASERSNVYTKWRNKADLFNTQGFSISVDTLLEQIAPLTDQQRANGYDMADYLLKT